MSEGPHEERFLHLSVSRSVGEAPSLEAGIQAALEDVCEWTDWVVGQAWIPTAEGEIERMPVSYVESEEYASFRDVSREFTFAPGEGIPGLALESKESVWFPDVSAASEEVYPRTAHAAAAGLQAGLGVPVVADGEIVVVLEFYLAERREVDERLVESVTSVAAEVGTLVARKQTEEALAEERRRRLEQYRALTDAANDVILTIDEESVIETVNPTVADVFGYEPDELVGESLTILMPDEFAEQHRAAIDRYLETGERTLEWDYVELPGEHADGSRIPLALSFSEVEFEGEQFFTGVIRDITERKAIQHRLEASNERLEQFAYAASHDLQEPLRMVSSYLRLVDDRYADELDEDGREFVEYAIDGAERMRSMIDGLLQYSRVETRGDPFRPVDLDDVFKDALADIELRVDESDAEISADDLPRVEGDANQLRQVFQNLLQNAIEYSGDEPPRIRVTAEREGSKWLVSVSDEGIGIEADAQERVFEVFQRLHSHAEHPGSGIGLALSRRIVERHDGEIWVESVSGEGSTFSFTLPAVDAPDE